MAFSFVLIGFSWLLDGKWKKYVIWCSVGFFIHYGIIVNVLFFFIIFITFNKRLLKPLNSLVIYTIFFVFFSAEWMEALIPFVESINLGTRYLSYQQNAEFWLTGGAAESQGLSWGNFVMAVFTIFGGYYVVNSYFKEKSFVILYNLVMVGLFLQPLGKQIELVFRIQELFNLFNKLFYALIFYAYLNHQRTRIALLKPIVLVIGFYTIYYYTTDYVFKLKENQTYFVWDSKGRSSLPIGELKD